MLTWFLKFTQLGHLLIFYLMFGFIAIPPLTCLLFVRLWVPYAMIKLWYWLVVSTALKNMKVSWDDYFRTYWEKMFQTTNQCFPGSWSSQNQVPSPSSRWFPRLGAELSFSDWVVFSHPPKSPGS